MFVRRVFDRIEGNEDAIARIRCGRIVFQNGQLQRIEQHWFRGSVSVAQVWWQTNHASLRGDVCRLDYHVPRGMNAFLTLDYIRSGDEARYDTVRGAHQVLDQIARRRKTLAIVAHITNAKLSDRLLNRFGWQRHLLHWRGRHFIRRYA